MEASEYNSSMADSIFVANVWAIIAKGWSSRGGDPAKEGQNITFPESCYGIDKVPHAWLFPRGEYNFCRDQLLTDLLNLFVVRAALHHGGAGTVGASLRAGIPTLIKPWFG